MKWPSTTSRFKVVASLLTVVGALTYVNWRLWSYAPETSAIAPPPAGNAAQPSSGVPLGFDLAPAQRSIAEFPQTTRRPLFFASRRPVDTSQPMIPVVAKPMAASAPLATLEQVQLVGIIKTGKGKARALIRAGTDGLGEWVGVGDHVRGWQLKEVGDDKAVFEANGQRVQVKLYSATTAGAK